MRRTAVLWIALLTWVTAAGTAQAAAGTCLSMSGDAARLCLHQYAKTLERCRLQTAPTCEEEARAQRGPLDAFVARTEHPARRLCSPRDAEALGYLDEADVALRIGEACADFGEEFLALGFAVDAGTLSADALRCQRVVTRSLASFRNRVVRHFGSVCFVSGFRGQGCDRTRRDELVERARMRAVDGIVDHCGDDFDSLQLSPLGSESTLQERVEELVDRVFDRARHFAQLVYPPNDLGPLADFGPFPVGVTTLDLVDDSRQNANDTGPRPVTTEVYYPSTAGAVLGLPRDIVRLLNIDIVETPAFRDVAIADGPFPLVVFSHGNGGIRIQSFFFAAHLASHGFIVATPDHHGNTFLDIAAGFVDAQSLTNRPIDMSFLIDEMLFRSAATENFFAGSIDTERIGMSGHSFGGLTSFFVAGQDVGGNNFHDARIKAIFPQAPAAPFPDAFFETITIPTLIVGGSIDETTPFDENQQRPFDLLPAGAALVAVAELTGAGHFTFSDFCEVPRNLLAFLGGFDEACEPRHLPWRHAHDIVNYLSLNFFDGVLKGNADALARLTPENLAAIEDLVYQRK
jgi:predicted dienelactone hydrolase